jgi:peptide chain release factor 3
VTSSENSCAANSKDDQKITAIWQKRIALKHKCCYNCYQFGKKRCRDSKERFESMSVITDEIKKRRTFAIISHPDAGKTTLTEKFLLYGGAINQAGSVKGKATAKHAVSDWMEIEKERGISVTSSVLQFNFGDCCINILDTPGHQDFSEDTYRTLMAADSAVMVIDASKGVEAQTRKLFKVCAMRHIPIFTFINKMDREARDTFDLLDEIEKELGIPTCPVNWPIGSGKGFRGVYDRKEEEIELFSDTMKGTKMGSVTKIALTDPEVSAYVEADALGLLEEEIELLDGASAEFDQELVDAGKLSPVFFGSALTNFGVETFLNHFLKMTSSPLPRLSDQGVIDPMVEKDFSAFVFKIQANMNKAHRDRIAFMRICSGEFEAGMDVFHVQGGKKVRLSQPQQMMASERKMIDKAYGGDIIGVFDPGIFSIGDTLTTSSAKYSYEGIPTFAPEHFARVRQVDTMKRKQFMKGINQIAQEGAIQIFQEFNTGMEEIIVGVVGVLQFDVLKYRLKNEYNVEIILENLPYEHIRWIENTDIDLDRLTGTSDMKKVKDLKGRPLLLFVNSWSIGMTLDRNEGLELSEFGRS